MEPLNGNYCNCLFFIIGLMERSTLESGMMAANMEKECTFWLMDSAEKENGKVESV